MNGDSMRVLITGSSGFIGSHLKKKLELHGHTIVEWDHKIDKAIENFELGDAEFVIHMAAWADVRASIKDPQLYWDNNITNTTKIQKMCYQSNVPLIYASSSCIHEWHKSPYGISKKVNEETAYAGQIGLRFTTVYGGDGAGRGMFMDKLKDRSLEYVTNHVRDFVHIDDVVAAITLLMNQPHRYSLLPAYDIGTGKGYVVSELAQAGGYAVEPAEGDECEALDNTADITEIKKLGWQPTTDVLEYIKSL
jgi:nucleoside-diphosphate-sugar epimerase|tara:strand:+ start:125 stop:874 length:750 start_codon:yes stop_codon:yes gene_type:complete